MQIVDSHFHWWPRSVMNDLCERKGRGYPYAEPDGKGGYHYYPREGRHYSFIDSWAEWHDLDAQFAYMDALGHDIAAVGTIGPFAVHFSILSPSEGREVALQWNEDMAEGQRAHPNRFWGTAAVPLIDTAIAIEVLDDAVNRLGLVGVNLPSSVGRDPRIDAARLEPFYDRVEALGVPLFLHPTDAVFDSLADDYNAALYATVGRVTEVSVAAARLIFSGIMERHPKLKVFMSHTGGMLPYQAGRLDKNGRRAKLAEPPSTYLKRFYTDTVSPHAAGLRFALDFFGTDHVLYGSDYPCWDPAEALRLLEEAGVTPADRADVFSGNVRRLFGLGSAAFERATPSLV